MSQLRKIRRKDALMKTFVCHRCENPLNPESFKNMDDEIFDELCHSSCIRTIREEQDDRNILLPIVNKKLESSVMRKVVLPINIPDVNDFMIIGDLSSMPLENSESLKITNAVNNLTADNIIVDHPICEECSDNILDQMDSQLNTTIDEHELYRKFLENFNDEDDEDVEELEAELNKLKEKEALLENRLHEFEEEKKSVKKFLTSYEEEAELLEKKDKDQWIEYFQLKHKFLSMEDSERSVNNQLIHAQAHLNKLRKDNVFDATFHIWHSGHFGTINNFRLGRLPQVQVPWTEINAAWGQTVLLLHCLARKINLDFERYKLVPCANHSYIVPLHNTSKKMPLYCEGGSNFVLNNEKYDNAMVAFLDCLQQFKEKVEEGNNSFHLPYSMSKGVIVDKNAGKYSIKISFNSEEHWTKALKYMLTNLKWALTWISTQFEDSDN